MLTHIKILKAFKRHQMGHNCIEFLMKSMYYVFRNKDVFQENPSEVFTEAMARRVEYAILMFRGLRLGWAAKVPSPGFTPFHASIARV